MHKELYVFSGLGADHRAFKNMNFGENKVHHVEWIAPKKKESIEAYAERIRTQIKHENPILMGLSLGGIMAIEVAKQITVEKIIILSSVKTRSELPPYFRLSKYIPFYKLAPLHFFRRGNVLTYWLFGLTEKDDKKLLSEILEDTDPQFMKWAFAKIATWSNKSCPCTLFHIHGREDRIFPVNFLEADAYIHEGGHFMVVNKAEEVSRIVRGSI